MAIAEVFDFTSRFTFFPCAVFALITLIFSFEFPFASLILFSLPLTLIVCLLFSVSFSSPSFVLFTSSLNTAFKKLGSPRSADSCFLSIAAPSRRAWLVFSTAFLWPMSCQRPVIISLSRNLPGGSRDRTAWTIDLDILIFSRFVLETYNSLLSPTRLRKLSFPGCLFVVTPLPHSTSLLWGFSTSTIFCSSTSSKWLSEWISEIPFDCSNGTSISLEGDFTTWELIISSKE